MGGPQGISLPGVLAKSYTKPGQPGPEVGRLIDALPSHSLPHKKIVKISTPLSFFVRRVAMAAPNGNLLWVGSGKAYRTSQIPSQKWAEYQSEVINVYHRSRSIKDVQTYMREKYGFDAT